MTTGKESGLGTGDARPAYTHGDRLRDILDENFGMQPDMTHEEALDLLERKLFDGRRSEAAKLTGPDGDDWSDLVVPEREGAIAAFRKIQELTEHDSPIYCVASEQEAWLRAHPNRGSAEAQPMPAEPEVTKAWEVMRMRIAIMSDLESADLVDRLDAWCMVHIAKRPRRERAQSATALVQEMNPAQEQSTRKASQDVERCTCGHARSQHRCADGDPCTVADCGCDGYIRKATPVWRNKTDKSLLDQTPEELAAGWEPAATPTPSETGETVTAPLGYVSPAYHVDVRNRLEAERDELLAVITAWAGAEEGSQEERDAEHALLDLAGASPLALPKAVPSSSPAHTCGGRADSDPEESCPGCIRRAAEDRARWALEVAIDCAWAEEATPGPSAAEEPKR